MVMTSMLPLRKDGGDLLPFAVEMLEGGDGEKARVLDDHLMAFHHVEERDDELIVLDRDDVVEVFLDVGEDLVARLLNRRAVGDRGDVGQLDDVARLERRLHAGGPGRFDADDLDAGVEQLRQGGNARGQPAASDGNEDDVDQRQLLHDLHGDGSLAGCDDGSLKGVDERQPRSSARFIACS